MTQDYMHGHHESVLRSHSWRTVENSAAYLLPLLTPRTRLLDVGAGPGTITDDLAGRVQRVTATEIDEPTLAATRSGVRRANVDFAVADVHRLQFADGAFDVVHAHQVLQHVADPVAALCEMRRVCAPGGVVAARDVDYSALSFFPRDPALVEWLELYRSIARAQNGEPDAGPRLLAWAHAAGFTEVTPSASVWCFATPADRAYWGGGLADRIEASRFGQLARAAGSTSADVARLAQAWRRWAEHPDGWVTLTHGEILAHR